MQQFCVCVAGGGAGGGWGWNAEGSLNKFFDLKFPSCEL